MKEIIPQKLKKFKINFSGEGSTTHSGMLLMSEFVERLGVREILDEKLTLKKRKSGYSEGEAILGFAYNIIMGGECLDDLESLRFDNETRDILGLDKVMAPTTAGEYLRRFSPGHIKQLEGAIEEIQNCIRPYQNLKEVTLDIDSSIYQQASLGKQGSEWAYNGEIGYHPLVCFIDENSEFLHTHFRRGSAYTSKKAVPFLEKALKRVQGAKKVFLRGDSGFYFKEFVEECESKEIEYGITADQTKPIMKEVERIKDSKWEKMPNRPQAEAAEFSYTPTGWDKPYRYIVKRENRYTSGGQLAFDFKEYRYHIFVTNREDEDIASLMG